MRSPKVSINGGAVSVISKVTSRSRVDESVGVDAGSLLVDADSSNTVAARMINSGGGALSVNAGGAVVTAITDTDAEIANAGDSDEVINTSGRVDVLADAFQTVEVFASLPGGGGISVSQAAVEIGATDDADADVDTGSGGDWSNICGSADGLVGRRLRGAGVLLETRKTLLDHANGDITTHYSAAELRELIDAAGRIVHRGTAQTPTLTMVKRNVEESVGNLSETGANANDKNVVTC